MPNAATDGNFTVSCRGHTADIDQAESLRAWGVCPSCRSGIQDACRVNCRWFAERLAWRRIVSMWPLLEEM
jgi:hypothetical protein